MGKHRPGYYREYYRKKHPVANSFVFMMFGKKFKDLTPEEKREYNKIAKRRSKKEVENDG